MRDYMESSGLAKLSCLLAVGHIDLLIRTSIPQCLHSRMQPHRTSKATPAGRFECTTICPLRSTEHTLLMPSPGLTSLYRTTS